MRIASIIAISVLSASWHISTNVAAAESGASGNPVVDNLVDWVRAQEDGFFSPKQEIRRDEKGEHIGIFATEDIAKGDVLFSIPWGGLITAYGKDEAVPDTPEGVPLNCDLVQNLLTEAKLGDASPFAPYVQYLMGLPEGDLPSSWSKQGQEFLEEIIGDLPPNDMFSWLQDDWYQVCEGGRSDLEEKLALLVVQNADDDLMIPLFDMYNHRNEPWHNADGIGTRGVKYDMVALHAIEAGEEIHTSYNLCSNCGGRALSYGTAEILRDYGMIEKLPQRWVFFTRDIRVDLEASQLDENDVEVSIFHVKREVFIKKLSKEDAQYLRQQVQRLERIGNLEWDSQEEKEIPEKEWDLTWKYHAAIVAAMKAAVVASVGGDESKACLEGSIVGGKCVTGDTYYNLEAEKDEVDYTTNTCDVHTLMEFEGYDLTYVRQTHYQTLNFQVRRTDKNVCMDLDDTVQICSNYRPHYHEYIVDYPARYVDEVKRVIFIGGGDSMILDEVLKYPELELVVGLELDQQVTRQVFKRMHTQPRFEDDRVEWWFGDATKSLLLLPDDYAASFDLVLVDLSETVVSLTVTDELDVLEALSLLLKPEGVMVKNEYYMNKMSDIFDFTAEIHVDDVPQICAQSMILGSNTKNFFEHNAKDRDVLIRLLDPLEEPSDRIRLFHDFRVNNATAQGKCTVRPQPELTEQKKAAGVLMVIDAEKVTLPLESISFVKQAVAKAAKNVGLTPVEGTFKAEDENAFVIALQEGYIQVRVWPANNYIAFDAHFWGGFNKYEALRDMLVNTAGSPKGSYQSYRIVVGGMFGYPDWKLDQSAMGPQLNAVNRNCDTTPPPTTEAIPTSTLVDILSHTIEKILWTDNGVAVAVCGPENEECPIREMLLDREEISSVVTVNDCSDIEHEGGIEDRAASMYKCEKSVLKKLRAEIEDESVVSAIVFDVNSSPDMAKIIHSIFSSGKHRRDLLGISNVVLAITASESEAWKRNVLEKLRKEEPQDPISRAEIILGEGSGAVELGILSLSDLSFMVHLDELVSSMEEVTGVVAHVKKVQSGISKWQRHYNPHEYLPGDYDPTEALKQLEEQMPLGRQSVFQLELGKKSAKLSADVLKTALLSTLSTMELEATELDVLTNEDMDGSILAAVYKEGSAVVIWDGRNHVDVNLFSYNEDEENATGFINAFKKATPGIGLTLRDDQPRGTGHVVNFQADIDHIDEPIDLDDDDQAEAES